MNIHSCPPCRHAGAASPPSGPSAATIPEISCPITAGVGYGFLPGPNLELDPEMIFDLVIPVTREQYEKGYDECQWHVGGE